MSDDSSDDEPLLMRAKTKLVAAKPAATGNGATRKRAAETSNGARKAIDSDTDSDVPIMLKKPKREGGLAKRAGPAKASFFGAENSARPTPANRPVRSVVQKERERPGKKRSTANGASPKVKKELKKVSNSEPRLLPKPRPKPKSGEGNGGEVKWKTLEHGGVMFPPEYEQHGVKMKYDGQDVDLNAEEEEVATMFAAMLKTDYMEKEMFLKNFWHDFRGVLKKTGKDVMLKDLKKCDFSPIYDYLTAKKEKEKADKAADGAEGRKAAKAIKDAQEASFKTALVDGKVEQVGNFRVEPPGLFRGRGEHPKMGKLKIRVYPSDITINIGEGAAVPPVPEMYRGQRWKEVRSDNTVTWLAFWKDPVNQSQYKYVWLAANSGFKTDADLQKYEKARKLKGEIESIRKQYTTLASSKMYKESQMGTAMYFIDKLALRAGHEKDEDEADTVGCCNLKVDNVELMANLNIKFDFLGKDSIRYENTVSVTEQIYNNIGRFKQKFGNKKEGKKKQSSDPLFCELDATDLNKFLQSLMTGLSVKVFRTYNASITLDMLLNQEGDGLSDDLVDKKVAFYNTANKEVAVLCNHQRAVPKTHDDSMKKMNEKVELLEQELEVIKKELKAAKRGAATYEKLDGTEGKPGKPDAVENKLLKKEEQIKKMQIQTENKEALKTVALGTSKINYLDPRITISWCKRNEVPLEKVFNKSLLVKFLWAMTVEPEFRF